MRTSRTVRRLTEALTLPVSRGECGYWATPRPRHDAPSGDSRCLSKNFFSISREAFAQLATQVRKDLAQDLVCDSAQRTRRSPEELRSRGEFELRNGIQSQSNYRERSSTSSGEIAPGAVDSFSAKPLLAVGSYTERYEPRRSSAGWKTQRVLIHHIQKRSDSHDKFQCGEAWFYWETSMFPMA